MRRYLPASLPLVIGLGLALLLQYGPWSNPVLTLRADLGTVLLLLGLAATLAWGCAVAVAVRRDRREAGRLACLRQEQADAHRRFLQRLDHELKNPITAIRAGLANLDEGVDGAILGSVRIQVNRLARLSADLRKLADLETQPLDGTAVDLSAVVAELADTPREHLEATGRSLQVILPRAPWPPATGFPHRGLPPPGLASPRGFCRSRLPDSLMRPPLPSPSARLPARGAPAGNPCPASRGRPAPAATAA